MNESLNLMRTANFLFQKTGLNLFKPGVSFEQALISVRTADGRLDQADQQLSERPQSGADEMNVQSHLKVVDSEEIHIGPRGGRYRLDESGRKIYLKAA